jgi:hypothetical protein
VASVDVATLRASRNRWVFREREEFMMYLYTEYSALIDSALVTALAVIVWAAYREVRRRKGVNSQTTPQLN